MTGLDSLNLLRSYLGSQQYGLAEEVPMVPQPFVTLSRETGAGGIPIGMMLREYLRRHDRRARNEWMWFDRDLLWKVAEHHNLPKEVAHLMDHSQYHRLLKWVDDLVGQYPSWSTLARKTSETILHLARIGNVILVGRGGHVLTRGLPGGVHVRLVGSLSRRIDCVAEFYHLTRLEAERFTEREDLARALYMKDNFGVDINDAHYYDILINTDYVTHEDAVHLIAGQVERVRERLLEVPVQMSELISEPGE